MVKLETSFWYMSIYLKALSLWPISPVASNFVKLFNLVHFFFVVIGLTLLFTQILLFVILQASDSQEVMEVLSTQVVFLHASVKVVFLKLRRHKLDRLLKSVKHSMVNGPEQLLKYLVEYARMANVLYAVYTIGVLILSMDYIMAPYWQIPYSTPLSSWYPFNYINTTLLYGLAYSQQALFIFFSWFTTGIDVSFGVFIFYVCAQCKILQINLLHLIEGKKGPVGWKEVDKRLSDCVKLHYDILRSTKDINDVYTYPVLVLFFATILTVCCAGLQITDIPELTVKSFLTFLLLTICVIIQLLLYYLPGNILIEESIAIRSSAYNSGWESLPVKHRKAILFIILRSATSAKLQIGRMGLLTLENYANFLVRTASYFTSIRSIVGTS
uniref:Odorant receptor n=1 Tax=Sirex noctilio TaxID=36765 RepID=A0A857N3I2_9HYME|nr:odorant receptor 4 [Sirex noctilio]